MDNDYDMWREVKN